MSAYENMLTTGLKSCVWYPRERQSQPFTRGGGVVVEYGDPYWEIELTYQNMTEAEWRRLTAWIARRRGGRVPFAAFPAMHREPLNGDPGSFSISLTGSDQLRVTSQPTLALGDFLSYEASGAGRFVGQVIEIVNQAGTYVDVRTFPPRIAKAGSDEIVDPTGYFRMLPDTLQMSDPYDPKKRASFKARQEEPSA